MKKISSSLFYLLVTGIVLNLTVLCYAESDSGTALCYGPLYHLDFSPDGKHFATSGAGGLFLWDVQSGRMVHHFHPTGDTPTISFSPDGTKALIVFQDITVWIWDISSQQPFVESYESYQ